MVTSKINSMKTSIKQLEIDIKNASKDKNPLPNDRFKEVMDGFVGQAKETQEVLAGMSKKMVSLYSEVADYFSFDTKKYTMDEFMTDIQTFIKQFQVGCKSVQHVMDSCLLVFDVPQYADAYVVVISRVVHLVENIWILQFQRPQ